MQTPSALANRPTNRRRHGTPASPSCRNLGIALTATLATLAACSSPPRPGASTRQDPPPTAQGDAVLWSLRPYFRHVSNGSSEFGDVGASRAGTEAAVEFSPADGWSVALNGKVERAHYSLPDLVTSGTPRGRTASLDLDQFEVGIQTAYQSSERWTHMLYGTLTSGLESGASVGDSLRSVLYAGSRYAPSADFGVMGGIVTFSQLEGDTIVAPLIGFDWRPAEDWQLTFGLPETSLTYAVSEDLQIGLRMDFEFFDYRLDDDGPLPGGALTNELVTLGLHTEWRWSDTGNAWLTLGRPLHNALSVHDSSGNLQFETDVDCALSISAGVEWTF